MYEAKILADSISPVGHRLTSFQVTFPRIVLAEVNTHKMLSKNSASSRAIPVAKKIAQVEADPFVPAAFIKNQPGMQGATPLDELEDVAARAIWTRGTDYAVSIAKDLQTAGLHKALANRVLEPYAWHTAIISATDWSNFWHLRVNPAAQGEFQAAAAMMLALYEQSVPRPLNEKEWHLPLVSTEERIEATRSGEPIERLVKISVARCARVSYLTHDGVRDQNEDLALYEKLVSGGHLSPLEHAARPMTEWELDAFHQVEAEFYTPEGTRTMRVSPDFMNAVYAWDQTVGAVRLTGTPRDVYYCGNYNGWTQHRKLVPGEADILGHRKDALGQA